MKFILLAISLLAYSSVFSFLFAKETRKASMSTLDKITKTVAIESKALTGFRITSCHASCPCLKFTLSSCKVLPLESVCLNFTMDLAGMEGRVERFIFIALEHGETNKTEITAPHPSVMVGSNASAIIRRTVTYSPTANVGDPITISITEATRSIILTVVGDANPSASLKPVGANFGTVAASKLNFMTRHTVLRGTNSNAQIVSISSAPAPFVVTAAGDNKGFSVALAQDARPGRYIDQLTVRTTDPDVPEMPFYLYAHILGDIEVLPNAIEVSPSQSTTSAMVLLRPTAKKAFRVLSARTVPDLGTLCTQSLPDGSWRIHLSDIPTADVLPRSFLLVETDLPDSKEIKLPIAITKPLEAKP